MLLKNKTRKKLSLTHVLQISFKYPSVSPKIVNDNVCLATLGALATDGAAVKSSMSSSLGEATIRTEGARIAIIVPRSLIREIYRADLGKVRDI